MDLAERVDLPVGELSDVLATLQAQPNEARMAKVLGGVRPCPWQTWCAHAFQLELFVNVLERGGVVTTAEVLEEIKRLPARTPNARGKDHERR